MGGRARRFHRQDGEQPRNEDGSDLVDVDEEEFLRRWKHAYGTVAKRALDALPKNALPSGDLGLARIHIANTYLLYNRTSED